MEAVVEVSCTSNNDEELNLSLGDVITNVVQIDNTWFEGQLHGKKGRFREEYVKLISKDSSKGSLTDGETKILRKDGKRQMVKALYSYAPSNDDELELKVHDIIEVIEQTEEGWWKGILNDSIGMFPSNFVAEINYDVPDTTALKGESALKSTGKRDSHIIPANISASPPSHKELKPKSNATSTEESSKTSSTTASDKRSSLIMKKSVSSSSDMNAPQLPPKPVREQAKVLYPYEALNEDELTLKEGDIIFVISKEIEDKGWWKGELNNQIGVFPDNFVELIKTEEIIQKKPERPDKPVVPPVPTKVGSNVEFQEKLNAELLASSKKVHKFPPAKPPPPELHKKEEKPERPLPPHSIKKPQLPPPMKKPLRSSLGMRLPSSSSTSSASNSVSSPVSDSPPPTSIGSSMTAFSHKSVPHLPSPDESIKLRLPSESSSEDKNAHEFDLVEVSTDKLLHVTANRAKFPNRRPPSHVFLRENEKENGIPEEVKLIKDVEEIPTKFKPALKESQSKEVKVCKPVVIPSQEEKPKVPPYRPALPAQIRTNVTKVSKPEPLNAPQPAVPHIIQASTPSIPSSEPSSAKVSKKEKVRESITTDLAKDQNAFQIELSQLRNEIKKLKESSICKTEYEKLATTVLQLKEAFEMHKSECKKQIQDLKAELEEEKKCKVTMQKEKRKE